MRGRNPVMCRCRPGRMPETERCICIIYKMQEMSSRAVRGAGNDADRHAVTASRKKGPGGA